MDPQVHNLEGCTLRLRGLIVSMSISGLSLKALFFLSAYINKTGKKNQPAGKGGGGIVVLSFVITAGPPGSVANVRVMG